MSAVNETLIPLWLSRAIDQEMPTLSDTEMRVLLVVLRQTAGRGKDRDWLARSQLVTRTGRSLDAVSRAVDMLVRRGLIIVEDAAGRSCDTPEARRAVQGKLYFRGREALLRKLPSTHIDKSSRIPPVLSQDSTETTVTIPVVTYDKTQPEVPLWLDDRFRMTSEEAERTERAKQKIRETLRRRPIPPIGKH